MSAPAKPNEAAYAEAAEELRRITNRLRWHERDVFLAKLTPETTVTIRSAGPFDAPEIDRLIQFLTVQRDALV